MHRIGHFVRDVTSISKLENTHFMFSLSFSCNFVLQHPPCAGRMVGVMGGRGGLARRGRFLIVWLCDCCLQNSLIKGVPNYAGPTFQNYAGIRKVICSKVCGPRVPKLCGHGESDLLQNSLILSNIYFVAT